MQIPFNKPCITGREVEYISDAINQGKLSGNGKWTHKCHQFFQTKYGFNKVLLTTSCTDALEMSAILIDIGPGDEVIIPSYTFVSSANAFVLRGAKVVFADSEESTPNMDANKVEALITERTKAIIAVHYAGVACDMDKLNDLAKRYNLFLIEDAAQAIDSYYNGRVLGSIGHLAAFSFHETKNINSGEGGLLVINDERFVRRSEIIWEKGTNRSAFFRGEANKYGWVDIGSSFLPSELNAAFLYAQLEEIDSIQAKRLEIWKNYYNAFLPLSQSGKVRLPHIPDYATNNAHMFYLVCSSPEERDRLLAFLKSKGILAVFHYLSLHQSEFYKGKHDDRILQWSDYYADHLVRLPFYVSLTKTEQAFIVDSVKSFYCP